MADTINTFVLSAGIVQGLLLVMALLLKNPGKKLPNVILSVFILILTVQLTFRLINEYWLHVNLGPFYSVFYFLPYLYGPLVYFYIMKGYISNKPFSFKDLAHTIPFFYSVLLSIVTGYGFVNIFRYISEFAYNITDTFVQVTLLTIYIIICKRRLKSLKPVNSAGVMIHKTWLNGLTNLVLVTGLVMMVSLTFIYYNTGLPLMQFVFINLTIALYWISYKTLTLPGFFKSGEEISARENIIEAETIKYKKTGLGSEEAAIILNKLNNFVSVHKPHLDPEISVEKLSSVTGIAKHHISQVINQKLSRNFYDFINERRISHAKELLLSNNRQNFTIAAIAYESGFNSLSSFNDVFKKHTGLTPSGFKKLNLKDIPEK